jgi:alpha,alpha-trehalase
LSQLRREEEFWMRGADGLKPAEARARVVVMQDGTVLNRYWDDLDTPRDESFREDTSVAASSGRPAAEIYRDIRAASESGWDFSSRWLGDGHTLATIRTTAIVPVDLNSLLYGLEQAIATGCERVHDPECARGYSQKAMRRRAAMTRYLWNADQGRFADYDWVQHRQTDGLSAATLYPLFVGSADRQQAAAVITAVRGALLQPGGLVCTLTVTGQQWDAPNGWPPLQWIAVSAFELYGQHEVAHELARRWIGTVSRVYGETGKLLEKYDVERLQPGGGGEYPLQDGFGWTNGVTQALLHRYPDLKPTEPRARP